MIFIFLDFQQTLSSTLRAIPREQNQNAFTIRKRPLTISFSRLTLTPALLIQKSFIKIAKDD